jgi:hypothetical protein
MTFDASFDMLRMRQMGALHLHVQERKLLILSLSKDAQRLCNPYAILSPSTGEGRIGDDQARLRRKRRMAGRRSFRSAYCASSEISRLV